MGRDDPGMNGGQDRHNAVAGAFAGNGGFRGGRGGFGPQPDNHNQNSVHYTGYQTSVGVTNASEPRHDTSNQNGGYESRYHGYGQQHFQNDFGGALWGQNGGLGDGTRRGHVPPGWELLQWPLLLTQHLFESWAIIRPCEETLKASQYAVLESTQRHHRT